MRLRHYWRHQVRDAEPEVLAGLVCDPAGTIATLRDQPRPPLSGISRWIAFLTTPFKFFGISGWKETGCDAKAAGVPCRPAQHSTDGFWTIDVALEEFRIGDLAAPSGKYLRIEVEPGTSAHAICERHAIGPSMRLELSGPLVIDRDAGGFLEVHPEDDFRIVRTEEEGSKALAAPEPEDRGGPAAPKREARRRVAILVIHGIGEQQPYETLDSFARGIARHFQGLGHRPVLRPERVSHGKWTEAALHMEFVRPATRRGLTDLGIHEFYWAPYTEGKVTTRDVLEWIAVTCLSPLRYLSENLDAIAGERGITRRGFWTDLFVFAREVARAAILYLPLIAASAGILVAPFFFPQLRFSLESGRALDAMRRNPGELAALLGFLASSAMFAALVWLFVRSLSNPARRKGRAKSRERVWRWLALAAAAPVAAAVAGLFRLLRRSPDVRALVASFRSAPGPLAITAWVVALVLGRYVLVKFVGDIAVYVTADSRVKNYEARHAILENGVEMLEALLIDANREYDEVLIAGHSLGSVVAFDLIDRLLTRTWAKSDPEGKPPPSPLTAQDVQKIRGLVTFGSPLDKVFYFFRGHVGRRQGIRAQLVDFLHSFRRLPPAQSFGSLELALDSPVSPNARPESSLPVLNHDFRWINVWSPGDPVSGKLRFYAIAPSDQRRLFNHRYWLWGFGHLAYWRDDAFYGYVTRKML